MKREEIAGRFGLTTFTDAVHGLSSEDALD
jgi:hypothetical protein